MAPRTDRRPAPATSTERRPRGSRKSGFGGTLLGLFIGIALGLALAAGVAYYLTKAGNPYQAATPGRESPREATKETGKAGRPEASAAEKPRFDFYKILPGVEEPKFQPKAVDRGASDRATVDRAVSPDKSDAKAAAKGEAKAVAKTDDRAAIAPPDKQAKAAGDRFWLQAGSFANQTDAEDLKARLAFAGWEATIQSATVPDKGVRYRVRLGPYDNTEALQRMKSDLAARGFDVAVIKF
ncbi:MAG: SPOR domain-containing protein [Betaproteobacteria bacterium]